MVPVFLFFVVPVSSDADLVEHTDICGPGVRNRDIDRKGASDEDIVGEKDNIKAQLGKRQQQTLSKRICTCSSVFFF